MQSSNAPVKLKLPFASSGGKNAIPNVSQIGIVAGAASYPDGFPPLTRTPIVAGGVPPSGLDMNGVLFEMTAIARWLASGAGFAYDAAWAADSDVGGYPKGARVMRSDGVGYWLNTAENNTTDPETGGEGWVPDYTYGIANVTMTSSNVTLTALEYGKRVIAISGTLTANLNLIFPAIVGEWVVINNTTGAFTVTCKTSAGTGLVVDSTQVIVGDGTNIYSATSDSVSSSASAVVGTTRNAKMLVTTASASGTFTADEIVVESTLGGTTYKIASYSQAVNLATTGAGGMDTGSAPTSGFVSLYAIAKADGTKNILACNVTTSSGSVYSGANMPAGYVASALIGIWPTNGSSQFVPGMIADRKFQYQTYPAIFTGHAQIVTYTSQSISVAVPTAARLFSTLITGAFTSGGVMCSVSADATGIGAKAIAAYAQSGAVVMPGGAASNNGGAILTDCAIITPQTTYVLAYQVGGGATVSMYVSDFSW